MGLAIPHMCRVRFRTHRHLKQYSARRGDPVKQFALAGLLLLSCAAAFGAGNDGTLTRKKTKSPMIAVHAGMTMSELGSGVVVFADTAAAADGVSVEPGKEPESVASEISSKGSTVVVLKIMRNLSPMLWLCADHCQRSIPFDEKTLQLALTRYDDQRIEGSIKGVSKQNGMSADLSFALDLHNVAEASEQQGPNYAHDPLSKLTPLPAPERPATPSAVYNDGVAYGLADSYAFAAQDEFNHDPRNRGRPVLIFTDLAMNKAALADSDNVLRALNEQHDDGKIKHILILRLLADGKVFIDLRGDEPTYTAMGDDSEVLKLSRNDGKRVEGSYDCKDQNEKRMQGHVCFDLKFALDVARAK